MDRPEEDHTNHVYLWRIRFDIWQNQYNIVKLKNKINKIKSPQIKKNDKVNHKEKDKYHMISLVCGI